MRVAIETATAWFFLIVGGGATQVAIVRQDSVFAIVFDHILVVVKRALTTASGFQAEVFVDHVVLAIVGESSMRGALTQCVGIGSEERFWITVRNIKGFWIRIG